MPVDTQEVLRNLDGVGFIKELFPNAGLPDQAGEVRFLCPFHGDSNPSASFNVTSKLFRCFSCGATGDAISLLAQTTSKPRPVAAEFLARRLGVSDSKAISPQLAEQLHAQLRANASVLGELERRRGIDVKSVERWRLGWMPKEQRLVIPVRDELGSIVNLRQYDLLKVHDVKKKFLNLKGHGDLRLFPLEALQEDQVVLTEGELKMIGLQQRGFNSITATGGARGWKDEWDKLFAGKSVVIVYDVDDTGQARARTLARRLATHAKEVRLITLPLDRTKHPHGDVLDYFVKDGYSAQDFHNLILGTPPWEPEVEAPGMRDDLEYEVDLAAASKAQYYLRKLVTPVIVSAKDTSPYIVPKSLKVTCSRDLEVCAGCPVFAQSEDASYDLTADDPDLLQLIDVSTRVQDKVIRGLIGIPERCGSSELVVTDTHNLEEVRLVPQLNVAAPAGAVEQTVVKAYFVGHGIETNSTYSMRARAAVDPRDQHATLLIFEAVPNVDSLTSFRPTADQLQELEIFRPTEWTVEAIRAKLDELYTDLEGNVTRVYQRRALHALMDLTWHSALYVSLTDEPMKGWVDALVIGDSGQGKSETATRLLQHYGLGEKVDMKGASTAGLKGGLQDTQGRWFVTWGVIPLNDRRMVVLEEVKGCPQEVLQTLTDMRSSGIAELTKIERRRAFARTRLLWISNPRSDRRIETYNFGVLAVKELMGSLEDVRRFDAVLVVASNEVDPSVISRALTSPAVEHRFEADLCRRLILWAWSRAPYQVQFEPEAKQACYDLAVEQASRYSSSVPLVEPADHRLKLARLAAALAARTFSASDDRQVLIVREAHVKWVAEFLDEIYSSRFMGYDSYSRVKALDNELINPEEIKRAILELQWPEATVRGLMRATEIRQSDLMDWAQLDKDDARDFLSMLVRCNGLQRKSSGYYKTGPFIELLKSLDLKPAGTAKRERGEDEF